MRPLPSLPSFHHALPARSRGGRFSFREARPMGRDPRLTRRRLMQAAAGAGLAGGLGPARPGAGEEPGPGGPFLLESQRMPEPRVVLPTDALPPPDGPPRRIAAITTAYFKYSHADDIITKFIE